MKKLLILSALTAAFSLSAMAADFTGYVIDQKCSTKEAMRGNVDCANKCIKGGSPAVLVTDDGKIYKLAEQDKVVPHAGEKVNITGKRTGNTISVEEIKTAS